MRKPLKYQIMLPMLGVVLVTLLLFSVVDAWMAGYRARRQIEHQLRDIGVTLEHSTFRLTDRVLEQMRGLSGADFVLSDSDGTIIASSRRIRGDAQSLTQGTTALSTAVTLDKRVRLGNATYFHVPLHLTRGTFDSRSGVLHCFYPETSYQQAWREAVMPPLILGSLLSIIVIAVSSLVARRVTRPVQLLSRQIERIAHGEFVPLDVPRREDELQDLSIAVNRMAEMLAQYEGQVRRTERLRTLDQLGGGIAHQLRNSVTGCRMAVDLHRRHCPAMGDASFDVAIAQLELMEKYLKKFLSLGKRNEAPFVPLDLTTIINEVLPLVRAPSAHLGVELQWHPPESPMLICGDADALSGAVVNLLLNAVEAAAERRRAEEIGAPLLWVSIDLQRVNEATLRLEVYDSGVGPDAKLQDHLFEPLVSGKHDGVGLGLAIVREIAQRHGGSTGWRRERETTCFYVELPAIAEEIENANVACC